MRLRMVSVGLIALLGAARAGAAPPGFAFLEIPAGARATALGGAYASLCSGVEGMYWNPASLAVPRGLAIAGGHSELLEHLRHDYFAVGGRTLGGTLATSVRALYSEPIEARDELGNLVGSFGAHDLEFALGYAHAIGDRLTIGGSTAVVRERIANLAAMTYDFGAGISWDPGPLPGVRVAVTGQNLGPSAHYTIDGVEGAPIGLPAAVQAGVSYTSGIGERLRLAGALETRTVRGRSAMAFAGTEVSDASGAAVRLGMRFNDTASTLSFGAGYALPGFTADYAFVPLRLDLGDTHRFSFSTHF